MRQAGLLASAALLSHVVACNGGDVGKAPSAATDHEGGVAGSSTTGSGGARSDDSGSAATNGGAAPDSSTALDGGTPGDAGPEGDSGDGDGAISLSPLACDGTATHFAATTFAHRFGPGQNVGQSHFPAWVYGPPEGLGNDCQGATESVVSLGNGGTVTLGFGEDAIVDGPGPDFVVFENAFAIDCDPANVFAELATVEVSDDGVTWRAYPCTATKAPYGACAGTHPVYANARTNTIDPRDPSVAGGDAYDLADVGLSRARLVRITDRPDTTGISGVFDLDAVAIVNSACP
ncbi:MAG TPA: hypothetical protein VHE30_14625 [Polyangiaceae bacterium]|nr:hypothetical protein [Polyangiaceae bacterium]